MAYRPGQEDPLKRFYADQDALRQTTADPLERFRADQKAAREGQDPLERFRRDVEAAKALPRPPADTLRRDVYEHGQPADRFMRQPTERPDAAVMGLPERAAKRYVNELVLKHVEAARPSTATAEALATVVPGLQRTEELMRKWEAARPPELPETSLREQWLREREPSPEWATSPDVPIPQHLLPRHIPPKPLRKPLAAAAGVAQMLKEQYSGRAAARVRAYQELRKQAGEGEPLTFDVPAPETIGERAVDIGADLGAFLTKLWIAKRVAAGLPIPESATLQNALAWELVTSAEGEVPGKGALMAGSLRAINALGSGKLWQEAAKTVGESALFAGIAQAHGADLADTVVAALIPPTMRGFRAARAFLSQRLLGARTMGEAWKVVRQARSMRKAALRELGLNPNATNAEIDEAYRSIALRTHPDVAGKKYEAVFKRAAAARSFLKGKGAAFDAADAAETVPPSPTERAIVPAAKPAPTAPTVAPIAPEARPAEARPIAPVKTLTRADATKARKAAERAAKLTPEQARRKTEQRRRGRERGTIERELLAYHAQYIGPIETEREDAEGQIAGGEQYGPGAFSTSFPGTIPQTLRETPEGRQAIRKGWLKENVRGGMAEDAYRTLGSDEYVRRLGLQLGGRKGDVSRAVEAAEEFARQSDDTAMLLKAQRYRDLLGGGIEGDVEAVHVEDLKPGDTFTLTGEQYTVQREEDGALLIQDGIEGYVYEGQTIIMDAGSLTKAPAPAAPAEKPRKTERPHEISRAVRAAEKAERAVPAEEGARPGELELLRLHGQFGAAIDDLAEDVGGDTIEGTVPGVHNNPFFQKLSQQINAAEALLDYAESARLHRQGIAEIERIRETLRTVPANEVEPRLAAMLKEDVAPGTLEAAAAKPAAEISKPALLHELDTLRNRLRDGSALKREMLKVYGLYQGVEASDVASLRNLRDSIEGFRPRVETEEAAPKDLLGREVIAPTRGKQREFMLPTEHGPERIRGPAHTPTEIPPAVESAEDVRIREKFAETETGELFERGGVQVGRIPVSMEPAGKPISAAQIVRAARREFGTPIRIGHFAAAQKRFAGIYKPRPEVIRVREANNLATVAHEIAHHIDKKHVLSKRGGRFSQAQRRELGQLDYDAPKKHRSVEGFAEYIRYYLTTGEAAQKAPDFHRWFTGSFLRANPAVRDSLGRIRGLVSQWAAQGAEARVDSALNLTGKVARPPGMTAVQWARDKASQIYHRLRTWFVTDLDAMERFERTVGRDLRFKESPAKLAGMFTQAVPDLATDAVENGVHSLVTGKKIGPSLRDAFAKVGPMSKAEYREFLRFIYARHAIEVWAVGKNPGISLADARYVYAAHKDTPNWLDASNTLTQFSKSLVTVIEEVGRISPAGARAIREAYAAYVPLQRVFETTYGRRRKGSGRSIVDVPSPIKRLKGSGRQVLDPIQGMIEQAEHVYSAAAKTLVAQKIVSLANAKEGLGEWVERIPAEKAVQLVKLEQIKKQLAAAGVDLGDADLNAMIALSTNAQFYRGGEPIAIIYRNGKAEWYQFHPDLYRAIAALEYYKLPWFLDLVFGRVTRAVRLGATALRPDFAARNAMRDTMTFAVQSEYQKGPLNLLRPAGQMFGYARSEWREFVGKEQDPFVAIWKRYGGKMAQPLGLDRRSIRRKVRDVMGSSKKRQALGVIQHPINTVREVIGVTEAGGRLAELKAVMKQNGWTAERLRTGEVPPMELVVEAISAANEVTVNFKRAGTIGRVLNRMIPFFNANVQGTSKTQRTFFAHKKRTALRWATYLAIPTVLYWWYRKDDDDYAEQEPWLKYGFWTFRVGEHTIRIPRPFEHGALASSLPEAALEAAYRNSPKEVTDALREIAGNASPDFIPAALNPILEVWANYDRFRERPIVSRAKQDLEARDQHTKWNTWFAKKAGDYLNISPAKIDHLMSGYTGGLLPTVLRQTESIMDGFEDYGWPDIPGIGGFFVRGEGKKSIGEFYDIYSKTIAEYRSAKLRGEVPGELRWRNREVLRVARKMSRLRKTAYALDPSDPQVPELYRQITGLAREALGKKPLERYPAEREAFVPALPK